MKKNNKNSFLLKYKKPKAIVIIKYYEMKEKFFFLTKYIDNVKVKIRRQFSRIILFPDIYTYFNLNVHRVSKRFVVRFSFAFLCVCT